MLSKAGLLNKSILPFLVKGSSTIPSRGVVCRHYRGRTFVFEQASMEAVPSSSEEPVEAVVVENEQELPEEPKHTESIQFDDMYAKQYMEDCNQSPYTKMVRESDNVYRRLTGEEELDDIPSVERENVSPLNFEDEFFRVNDEADHRYLEDDVNDTLEQANVQYADEAVTYVKQDNTKEFFDRILAMDENSILTEEEKRRLNIVREDKREEEKEIKRNTWFNFMPAKEKPEGMFGTYSPDQIYSSLVFDLLSRNVEEVYKYEKDELFLNEEILKHTKLPEPIQPPSIPLYPNFQEYAKWVTFAVNRNSHYSMEEKQKVVDILARLGSLNSDVDDSPKTEFKIKKYL